MTNILEDKETIIERITNKTHKTQEEIEKIIEEKKEKFSGLLTDAGAAFMIAKELGVNLEIDKEITNTIKINKLEEGLNNIDLNVIIKQILSSKKFEKNGKKGHVRSIIVADDTGEIRLSLWHDDSKKIDEDKIERGTPIHITNCFVNMYNDKKQLSIGYNGHYEIIEKPNDLPNIEFTNLKIKEIKSDMNDINIYGRIVRIFESKEFEKEGRKGQVLNFILADETGTVRSTAWNDLVDQIKKLKSNDIIKIENAYTKEGLNGVELQLGWQARILKDPKNITMPDINESELEKAEKKKINELTVGSNKIEITGKITDIYPSKFFFLVCDSCGRKATQVEAETYVCENCKNLKEPEKRAVISMQISDDTGSVRVVGFGQTAEKMLDTTMTELSNKLETTQNEDLVQEFKDKLGNKELIITGRVKENSNSGDLEIIASDVSVNQQKIEPEKNDSPIDVEVDSQVIK